MKKAFTMIELIFVIVLLGILSSIAVPKLAGTRDDAEAVRAAEEIRTLITDLASFYTASGHFDQLSKMTNVSLVDSSFNDFDANLTTKAYYCNGAKTDKCIGVEVSGDGGDLNVSIQSTTSSLCRGLANVLKDSIEVHHFGGVKINYD